VQALKRFLKVQTHFEDFQEDQFDFHGYCVRKMVSSLGWRWSQVAWGWVHACHGMCGSNLCAALCEADVFLHRLLGSCSPTGVQQTAPRHYTPAHNHTPTPAPARLWCPALLQTLRAYVGMLRMEDRLYAHPTYLKGMSGAISAYLQLHDSATAGGGPGGEEALLAGITAEEQKK
jgi:hypothetical protein